MNWKMRSSERRFSEVVAVAAREVPQQVAVLQRPFHASPGEAVQHRRQLPEIAHEQEPHIAIQRHASHVGPKACVHLGDLLSRAGPKFCAAQCVFETSCTTSPPSRSCSTMRLARCVFPVPGSPVSRGPPPPPLAPSRLKVVEPQLLDLLAPVDRRAAGCAGA